MPRDWNDSDKVCPLSRCSIAYLEYFSNTDQDNDNYYNAAQDDDENVRWVQYHIFLSLIDDAAR